MTGQSIIEILIGGVVAVVVAVAVAVAVDVIF